MKNRILNSIKVTTAILFLMIGSLACQTKESNNSVTDGTVSAKVKAPNISIHDATVAGDIEAVKQHIAAKSDLNSKDPFGGSTPLLIATVFDKPEIAKILIEAGADLNKTNNDGSTPIHSASFFCRTEILQMLIDAGADKTIKNNFGSTALESVQVPFKDVEGIYNMMSQQLRGMGVQIDMKRIEATRPIVAEMLR